MDVKKYLSLPEQVRDKLFCIWSEHEFETEEQFVSTVIHAQSCDECLGVMIKRFSAFLKCNVEPSYLDMDQDEKHLWN